MANEGGGAGVTNMEAAAPNARLQLDADFLQMQGGESGMIIVTAPMNGTNYLSWSRAVNLALCAKMKLCFIDGSFEKPGKNDANYEKWIRTDSMREIASVSQGTLSVTTYFTKLQMLWDELAWLIPPQICTCGCVFFNGVASRENKQVQVGTNETADSVALHTKWMNAGGFELKQGPAYRGSFKGKDGGIDKRSQHCTHCLKPGHTKENCFKLHGFPDWYKTLVEQRRKDGGGRGFHANGVQDKSVELKQEARGNTHTNPPALAKAVNELVNLMKGKMFQGKMLQDPLRVNFATDDFTGIGCALAELETNDLDFWIVDIGATNHMCARLNTLTKIQTLSHQTLVYLPDGSSKPLLGTVILHEQLTLSNVLYIPTFNFNLLSVQKLCSSSHISFSFFPSHCTIQDLRTNKIIGVGRLLGSLFIIDKSSFDLVFIQRYTVKTIRSDNITEFVNSSCYSLFQNLGILHQTSSPYTPEQNGVVERKHKHLLTVARALMFERSLPLLYHKPPTLNHIRVFGCLCYATNLQPHKDKFAHRALKCIFLGHCQSKKAYKANQDANWMEAMQQELSALESNHTWDLNTLPQGKQAIGSRWVYKLKHKPDGNIERYKARLVATGYTQIEGEDYSDSFSPVAKTVTTKYLHDILVDCYMTKAKPTATPLPPGIKFEADVGHLLPHSDCYRHLVGRLLYLGVSHPDISFAIQQLSTPSLGLFSPASNSLQLCVFSDSDWAACIDSRRSIIGYCVFLGGALVS
ncbi:UNVERIFIED_CONTAM: Copia protein [Sesamum latifolium]|uniref:Copia protein n=1 Tax=Sesamum latifolium TaxID=2727402 RepID=A0AAW2VDG0_9LAMI